MGSVPLKLNDILRAIEVGIPVKLIQRCVLLGSARILRKLLEMQRRDESKQRFWISMSTSMFLKSQKAFLLALDPLRQISGDLNKAKDVLGLIQEIVLA